MKLYRGLWPQVIPKLAKYAVKFVDKSWKVTVLYEAGEGLKYLAVEGGGLALVEQVNAVKNALRNQPGGTFYVNEYRHVLIPIAAANTSHYYYAGRLESDMVFEYEGRSLTTKPIRPDGTALQPGDKWVGPRPGIPYVLAAGAADVHYETPALTDDDPPRIRAMTTRKVQLSKVLADKASAKLAGEPIANIRGHQGGRFYVNEHGAIFTPVASGDGNGLDYIYCGKINRSIWFPEPPTDAL